MKKFAKPHRLSTKKSWKIRQKTSAPHRNQIEERLEALGRPPGGRFFRFIRPLVLFF